MARSGACVGGTVAAAVHYELTAIGRRRVTAAKLAVLHTYPCDMAQNFWGAIWAWTTCFVVTIAVSLATSPKPDADLKGLVYGLTPHSDDSAMSWYLRPAILGVVVLACTAALNVIFW